MGKNILLVDDDEVFHLLSSRLLKQLGITKGVHSVRNGREAINFISKNDFAAASGPDVIFLDLNMPIMDGFSFIEAFKKMEIPHKERIVIIIVSSSQDPKDLARAADLGIVHYLTKPITEKEIKEVLTSIGVIE
jgi:CheY-like chemotaxis protein